MSNIKSVSLINTAPKFLLLSVDEQTGKQNAVSLIAYGQDPDAPDSTLIFSSPGPFAYQEIRLMMEFDLFHMIMDGNSHLSVTNISQAPARINPNSELGQIVANFKALIAANAGPAPSASIN